MTWSNVQAKLAHLYGPQLDTVWVSPKAPHLAVHVGRGSDKGWTVCQIPTGRTVLRCIKTENLAREAAVMLAAGCDWSGTYTEARQRSDTLKPVRNMVAKVYGAEYGGPTEACFVGEDAND